MKASSLCALARSLGTAAARRPGRLRSAARPARTGRRHRRACRPATRVRPAAPSRRTGRWGRCAAAARRSRRASAAVASTSSEQARSVRDGHDPKRCCSVTGLSSLTCTCVVYGGKSSLRTVIVCVPVGSASATAAASCRRRAVDLDLAPGADGQLHHAFGQHGRGGGQRCGRGFGGRLARLRLGVRRSLRFVRRGGTGARLGCRGGAASVPRRGLAASGDRRGGAGRCGGAAPRAGVPRWARWAAAIARPGRCRRPPAAASTLPAPAPAAPSAPAQRRGARPGRRSAGPALRAVVGRSAAPASGAAPGHLGALA